MQSAINDEELSDLDQLHFNNLWIVLVNTQRSNYERAKIVREQGLAEQAAKSIAAETLGSNTFKERWLVGRPWHALASPEFVLQVETEFQTMEEKGAGPYRSGSIG